MKHTRHSLAYQLKQAREHAGLKQETVARYLGLTVSVLSAMENGHRKVDALELFALSSLYGKPLDWFFENTHPLCQTGGTRWYDHDALIRDVLFLWEKAPPELRHRVAYGVLGFLQ